jgi:hypothetical protein
MKVNLDNPIKPLKSISFEREENKECRLINNLARSILKQRVKNKEVNKKQLALITSTDIYFLPVKKYKFIR